VEIGMLTRREHQATSIDNSWKEEVVWTSRKKPNAKPGSAGLAIGTTSGPAKGPFWLCYEGENHRCHRQVELRYQAIWQLEHPAP
jgi:hypothetical protein